MKSALIPSMVSRRHRRDRFWRREVGVDSIYGVAMSSSGSSAASGVVVEIIFGIVVSSSRSSMVSRRHRRDRHRLRGVVLDSVFSVALSLSVRLHSRFQ